MELFLDTLPEDELLLLKYAAFATRLSETPENWAQELTSELFRQLPFLHDYEVMVTLDRVDPQRGFAFGYADVSGKTDRPVQEHADVGIPHIRVPIVIIERSAKPFSVFLDGQRVLPLTEERVRQTLFDPTTFDISNAQPRDPSLTEGFQPPYRFGAVTGGEFKTASADGQQAQQGQDGQQKQQEFQPEVGQPPEPSHKPFGHLSKPQWEALYQNPKVQKLSQKFGPGSKEVINAVYELAAKIYGGFPKSASLLIAIAPTIREQDAQDFVEKVATTPFLSAGFSRVGMKDILVQVFELTKRASANERLAVLAENILPTVATYQKLPGGDFLVKTANTEAFAPGQQAQGAVMPGQEAEQDLGQDTAQAMQPGQTATAVANPVESVEPSQTRAKVVEEFGQYKVQDAMGNSLLGHVFPTTMSWDGEFAPQPVSLFTNGSAYAVQEHVAGELVGKGTTLPSDVPRGDGVFYVVDGGEARATAPVTIQSSAAGPDGQPRFLGADLFGRQLQISLAAGLNEPYRVSDTEFALPANWKFMRLNGQTQLIPDPAQMNKAAAAKQASSTVLLKYNGAYHLEGDCGLQKLSREYRYDLDPTSAEFMLGVLGVDGATSKVKIAEARRKGLVKLCGLRTIKLLSERYQEAEKTASLVLQKLPVDLRRDLVKEAAMLEDSSTVDHVLALNFINPENLGIFISRIPELEEVGEKLAEMLLYSYLGMKEVPEGATERAMRNLEEVVTALKSAASAGQ